MNNIGKSPSPCTDERIYFDNINVIDLISRINDDSVYTEVFKDRVIKRLKLNKIRLVLQPCKDTDSENYVAINHEHDPIIKQEAILKQIEDQGLFVVKSEYFDNINGTWTTKHIANQFPITIGRENISNDHMLSVLDFADEIYCLQNDIDELPY